MAWCPAKKKKKTQGQLCLYLLPFYCGFSNFVFYCKVRAYIASAELETCPVKYVEYMDEVGTGEYIRE
jgi:hypothetical protein